VAVRNLPAASLAYSTYTAASRSSITRTSAISGLSARTAAEDPSASSGGTGVAVGMASGVAVGIASTVATTAATTVAWTSTGTAVGATVAVGIASTVAATAATTVASISTSDGPESPHPTMSAISTRAKRPRGAKGVGLTHRSVSPRGRLSAGSSVPERREA
jgi:hypothetical protein